MHFYLIIMDTGLVKKVHKGKARKTVVTECNRGFTIYVVFFNNKNGPKCSWKYKSRHILVNQTASFITNAH